MKEQRVTNEKTGGQKGAKPCRPSLIPAEFIEGLGEVFYFGSQKYDDHNFRKGYDWSLSMDALERHYQAFKRCEDFDQESGLHHILHTAWHCVALYMFSLEHASLDDRYRPSVKEPEKVAEPFDAKEAWGVVVNDPVRFRVSLPFNRTWLTGKVIECAPGFVHVSTDRGNIYGVFRKEDIEAIPSEDTP